MKQALDKKQRNHKKKITIKIHSNIESFIYYYYKDSCISRYD